MDNAENRKINMTAYAGAAPVLDPQQLLASQRSTLGRISLQIRQLADLEFGRELRSYRDHGKQGRSFYLNEQRYRRPHQVFLIDGARGSGKTTLLLTLQQYLKHLGRPLKWTCDENWNGGKDDSHTISEELTLKQRMFNNELAEARSEKPAERVISFRRPHETHGEIRKTVWHLGVIFPTELEANQSILEGVLATMVKTLDRSAKGEYDKAGRGEGRSEEREQAKKLIKTANEDVAKGWFLSKNAGQDAILQDSIDYKDFLAKKSETNVASFDRINLWREFVNGYLDHFGAEMLAVFFDDTDVAPASTHDILNTIRIFLDHPRIVTIIAGNLRSIRQDMLLQGMGELGDPIGALTDETESTAKDWRQFLRSQIEESLEKVMPRPLRHFVSEAPDPPDIPREFDGEKLPGSREDRSDFRLVFGMGFDKLCGEVLDLARNEFLKYKHRAHFRQLQDRRPVASEKEAAALEKFISWWMFRHWYAEQLRPRSARHLTALKAFALPLKKTDTDLISDELPSQHKKRLAVVLFEAPENHTLIHRLSDNDPKVLRWLHRQVISSQWRGDRYFDINERRIHERTYSYDFIRYRLDLGIGMPMKENPDESIPRGTLPRPSGPNLIGYRPFFPKMRRQKYYGVGAGLQHTVIPANCIYFSDVSALPDVAWAEDVDSGDLRTWGAQIIYEWPSLFFFDINELGSDGSWWDRRPTETMRSYVHEDWVRDYFANVVLPFSSADFGRYARTPNNRATARSWATIASAREDSLLYAEIFGKACPDAPGQETQTQPGHPDGHGAEELCVRDASSSRFFGGVRLPLAGIQRRLDFINATNSSIIDGLGTLDIVRKVRCDWNEHVLQKILHDPVREEKTCLRSHLSGYQWLVNDARRAWHAGRIFLNQRASALVKASYKGQGATAMEQTPEISRKDTFSRADRYTVPTSAAFVRWLERSGSFAEFMTHYRQGDAIIDPNASKDEDEKFWDDIKERLKKFGVAPPDKVDGESDPAPDLLGPVSGWALKSLISDVCALGGAPDPQSSQLEFLEERPNPPLRLDEQNLENFLTATKSKWSGGRSWPLFIDPATTHMSPPNGDAKAVLTARTDARLGRDYLFFLYGVTPTLPSLIHIETASALFAFDQNRDHAEIPPNKGLDAKFCAQDVLRIWASRVADFLCFVQNYRRVLEVAKLRMDVLTLFELASAKIPMKTNGESGTGSEKENSVPTALGKLRLRPDSFGVRMALVPDADFGTMGVAGISRFMRTPNGEQDWKLEFTQNGGEPKPSGDAPADGNIGMTLLQAEWDEFSKKLDQQAPSVKWHSMIDTVVENLTETMNFILVTKSIIDKLGNAWPPPPSRK